jgi:hypothetical protein
MPHTVGTKVKGYYAARDPVSKEYLMASGGFWSHKHGQKTWGVYTARWENKIFCIATSKQNANRIISGAYDYWRNQIEQFAEINRGLEQRIKLGQTNLERDSLQDIISNNNTIVSRMETYLLRKIEMLEITVTTTVTEEVIVVEKDKMGFT